MTDLLGQRDFRLSKSSVCLFFSLLFYVQSGLATFQEVPIVGQIDAEKIEANKKKLSIEFMQSLINSLTKRELVALIDSELQDSDKNWWQEFNLKSSEGLDSPVPKTSVNENGFKLYLEDGHLLTVEINGADLRVNGQDSKWQPQKNFQTNFKSLMTIFDQHLGQKKSHGAKLFHLLIRTAKAEGYNVIIGGFVVVVSIIAAILLGALGVLTWPAALLIGFAGVIAGLIILAITFAITGGKGFITDGKLSVPINQSKNPMFANLNMFDKMKADGAMQLLRKAEPNTKAKILSAMVKLRNKVHPVQERSTESGAGIVDI